MTLGPDGLPAARHDPDVLYTALITHHSRCADCSNGGQCPYAKELLMAWGVADTLAAQEQAAINAAQRPDDTYGDCADDLEFFREALRETYE